MNERIQELIKQSTHVEEPDGLFPREVFDKEKFAELIVKDCIDIALKSGSVPNKSEVAVAEADRIYHKIKEQFGVEK